MDAPQIRFATTADDVRIAFQDFGTGPATIYVPPFFNHLEMMWEQQLNTRVFERMAGYLRILLVENRGTGLSDSFETIPALHQRVADIEAVVTAAGVDEVNLIGNFAGGQMCVGYAVEHPAATGRLVLANCRVGRARKADADALKPDASGPYAYGFESERQMVETALALGTELTEERIAQIAASTPSALDHPNYLRWLPRFQRSWGSREIVRRQAESIGPLEISDIAAQVRNPTLITHTADNGIIHAGYARLLAELIPGSRLVEFPGRDHYYWFGRNWHEIIDAHIRFITQSDVEMPSDRRFAVVLFTDIVDSTGASISAGDAKWHGVLDLHDKLSVEIVGRHGGSVVKSTGDGLLATFVSPSRAVAAAARLRDELAVHGIPIRAGLHAGEIEVRGEDISGAVVHLAARVEQAAAHGEILTTLALRDLLLGSEHQFEEAGSYQLRGFDGEWRLFRLGAGDAV